MKLHRQRLWDIVREADGREFKSEGDGIIAVFASAARAARCAISMQRASAPLEEEQIGLRVGLESSELPEDEDDPTALGLVAAKRLCDAASPGQILCGPVLHQLLASRREFTFNRTRTQTLRGVGKMDVYDLIYERDQRPYEWTDTDARRYRELATIAVPDRAEQLAYLLCLIPYGPKDSFHAVDLGCGDAALSHAILTCFPSARVSAFERTSSLMETASACLHGFGRRATVRQFDLSSSSWLGDAKGAGCIVGSLLFHHLAGKDKARAYKEICERLTHDGALLIADIVQPSRPEQWEVYADSYDVSARSAAEKAGALELFTKFQVDGWNFYRQRGIPDEYPSPLADQLDWLRLAGFLVVDCFWLRSGFAIFGGYKGHGPARSDFLKFDRALDIAERSLDFASRIP